MISYSDDVWDALKKAYEQGPKMSWEKLVATVKEELGCDMPSSSVVRRRSIAEKWQREPAKLVKKTAKELNKKIKNDKENLTGKNSAQDSEKEQKKQIESDVKKPSNIVIFDKDSENKTSQKKPRPQQLTAAEVIKQNRNRSYALGELIGDTIASVVHIRDEVLSLGDDVLSEEELMLKQAVIDYKMRLIAQVVSLNTSMSIAMSNTANIDAKFWGLTGDDLKDQTELIAKRTAVMNQSSEKLALAKQEMANKKRDAFMRQLEIQEVAENFERNGE